MDRAKWNKYNILTMLLKKIEFNKTKTKKSNKQNVFKYGKIIYFQEMCLLFP